MSVQTTIPGLVSVILPVFNRPDFLKSSVEQVIAQTYENWELIIVDDGSTDTTPHVCREVEAGLRSKVRIIRRTNGGPGAARESGRLLARGEFLQYLDSDDEIDPKKFAEQVQLLRERRDCGVAYCRTLERTQGQPRSEITSQRTGEHHTQLFPRILSGCLWPTITPLFRREVSDRMGPWQPLRQEEDWEYDARIGSALVPLAYSELPLACTVHHAGPRAAGGAPDPARLRDRCRARLRILEHASKAGIRGEDPNMQNFAGGLFLLARQSAIMGLQTEALELLAACTRVASGKRALKVALFRLLAAGFGPKAVASTAEKILVR